MLSRLASVWRLDLARACLAAGTIAFALPAAISVALGPPAPRAHDEFSYLLMADTFAHGRLANPTHPMWTYLETFHVLQTPTYASKYPPAPGLWLALGQVSSGFPIIGSWLVYGAAAAAVCWMLGGWVSPAWALLGALLLTARPYLVAAWADSYWGGATALLGGALLLGAVPRLWRRTRAADALAFACGLLLLANSRPYEGLLVSLVPVAAVALRRLRGPADSSSAAAFRRLVVPCAVVLALGAGLMLRYNARVTGSPWRFPYLEYERQYSNVPILSSGDVSARHAYRHPVFQRYYESYAEYTYSLTSGSRERWSFKAWLVWVYVLRPFLGVSLLVPLLVALAGLRVAGPLRGPTAVVATAVALVLCGNLASAWIWPHYFAPAAGGAYVLVLAGLQRLRSLAFRGRPVGGVVLALVLAGACAEAAAFWPTARALVSASRTGWPARRARLEADLARQGGKHLVMVAYGPQHDVHEEWVYNRADVDSAAVVWARAVEGSSAALLEYFQDRQAWLLAPDTLQLVPVRPAVPRSGAEPQR